MKAERLPALSRPLRAFVRESPYERELILRFLRHAATLLPAQSVVLDAGAGSAPYRELFAHTEYITADHAPIAGLVGQGPDLICDLSAVPLESASLDAVVCTQVLEHVPGPARVLAEFRRLLRPGGSLFLTVPLIWEVHEAPHDYWRYTPYSLRALCEGAGFTVETLTPRGGCYRALACLLDGSHRWTAPLRVSLVGRMVALPLTALLRHILAPALARLDGFDHEQRFTLGYSCLARVPRLSE